ncbi:CHASE2 domain-containing serine/threonine-protein kinase [Chitinibacteraceae bacterium HSL-7]
MKRISWHHDGVVVAVLTALVLILWWATPLVRLADARMYDTGVRMTTLAPDPSVTVIAIDQQSLDNLGRWPWSREIHARLIDRLSAAGARVIASTVFFTEPQTDRGVGVLRQFEKRYRANPEAYPTGFGRQLNDALTGLDVDSRLAGSIAHAGNVVLPMLFEYGAARGEPDQALPDFIARMELEPLGNPEDGLPASVNRLVWPLTQVGEKSVGVGGEATTPDADGVVRRIPLAVDYYGTVLPSFATVTAARGLNLPLNKVQIEFGRSLHLGGVSLPIARDATFLPYFYARDDVNPIPVDSFYDVYAGKIAPEKYKGKVVLIGATALGLGTSYVTPGSAATPPVLVTASAVSALMQQHYFLIPGWAIWAVLGITLLVALYLALLLPRLSAAAAGLISVGVLLFLLSLQLLGLKQWMVWLPLMAPVLLLLVGHIVLTTKQYFMSEAKEQKSSAESAESNRMLGLAFQGQGQLDMAFDKFRRVPMSDDMMELMYNLALDFERKRQFNKAENVYRHMAKHDADYRDLVQKLKRAKQMSETVMLGGGSKAGGTMLLEDGVEKPKLGRYQLEKELGKGAMGVVYLGLDPTIGRKVAIKTMALADEFDADLLGEARERFFREAETAGRLNHPNIVSIFDAGEEHDLAYIAMEFLHGEDLAPYCQPGKLLPLVEAVAIVRQVAAALEYAHKHGVIHRDIKPANIMYDVDKRAVKVTDFGIARITDSSKTRTGMVLGTPSFMSPEQLSGKKIDGRSDLFSLGVMLYQLVTGHLPFVGESMAELMYRIANANPADPRSINPALPGMLTAIINKALAKDVELRFQTGAHFAAACAKLEAGLKQRAT